MTAETDQMQKAIIVTRVNLFDHYPVGLYAAVTTSTQIGQVTFLVDALAPLIQVYKLSVIIAGRAFGMRGKGLG